MPQIQDNSVTQADMGSAQPRVAAEYRNQTQGTPNIHDANVDSQTLVRQLSELSNSIDDPLEFYRQLFQIVVSESECLGMWHVIVPASTDENSNGQYVDPSAIEARTISDENGEALWDVVRGQVMTVVTPAISKGDVSGRLLPAELPHALVAAPVVPEKNLQSNREVVVAYFGLGESSMLRLQWLMGLVTQAIRQWQTRRTSQQTTGRARMLGDSIDVVNAMSLASDSAEAAIVMVNRLRKLFNVAHVAIANVSNGTTLAPLAVSEVEQFDRQSDTGKLLTSALSQAANYGQSLVWPAQDEAQPAAYSLPLENYAVVINAASVSVLAIRNDENEIVGAVLLASDRAVEAQETAYQESVCKLFWRQLDLVGRANRNPVEVLRQSLKPRNWSPLLFWGSLVLAVAMVIPLPYRVKCDCTVQPTARRFVAAPYSGILETTSVRVGDIVEKGQVIARMDGRQLRIEQAGLMAELEGARRKRDSARALREIAQSQIARSEMRRLQSEIELNANRMNDLEVRAPIDGMIVAGDLEKTQGAPLETGQTLFEVAPLENMVAEIGVPESEVQYVKQSQTVVLKLNAFPFKSWVGTVKSIHPSSEVIHDQTVFVTEVELENSDGLLRPGMEGNAKISTHWSPVGWNLFHRAWEGVRYWTVW